MMNENIKQFLRKNRVATVCFSDEKNNPYCFTSFFVFDEEHNTMVFKSSYGTNHEYFVRFASKVSGSVLPERLDILKIKGIQFTGTTVDAKEISKELIVSYYKKYPFGRVMGGFIWAIKLEFVKFTDNTAVFGQKMIWSATASEKTPEITK